MSKDVIYIDVEDDITGIIDKVKSSKEKIVALVPPKRIGVLQSAVNLRLLSRAAKGAGKSIVIITTNKALIALTAGASIPVASNLQSKPEVADVPDEAVDDGEDIIDGAKLPVGEHEKVADKARNDSGSKSDAYVGAANLDDLDDKKPNKKDKKAKKGKKVPNFGSFRKKLILIILAALLLIGGLIWAIFFAPAATVIISARTSDVNINDTVSLGDENSIEQGVLAARTETIEREVSVEFEATGEREVGEFATGSVQFTSDSFSALSQGITIPAGTIITAGGSQFATDSTVTLSLSGNTGSTPITAQERGTGSNGVRGSVSGTPSSVSGTISDRTSGGTNETVSIVTAEDVQRASEQLVEQDDDGAEQELRGRFPNDYIVVADSFRTERSEAQSNPSVGSESESGSATLTSTANYQLTGVSEDNLGEYLTAALEAQMEDQTAQRVYESGASDAELTFSDGGASIDATGSIGPRIDEDEVKDQVAGQRYGDIQSSLERIDGISDVDVEFSFFWVRTVPDNPDRITIEFRIDND